MTACTCPSGDGSLRWPCRAHPAGKQLQQRFTASDDGRVIHDNRDHADVILRVDGDFESDADRVQYAETVVARLNRP